MKLFASALLILIGFAVSPAAMAATNVIAPGGVIPKDTCHIGGRFALSTSAAAVKQSAPEPCGPDMKNAAGNSDYIAFRLEPMTSWSYTPINIYGMCYYITNASRAGSAYFVPARTPRELQEFFKHPPEGVRVVKCPTAASTPIFTETELCGGKLFSNTNMPYEDGATAVSSTLGLQRYFYYIMNKDREVLRSVTITPVEDRKGGIVWNVNFKGECPDPEKKNAQNGTPAVKPVVFDRNNASATQASTAKPAPVAAIAPKPVAKPVAVVASAAPVAQRTTPAATNDRVRITDGALIRNIQ